MRFVLFILFFVASTISAKPTHELFSEVNENAKSWLKNQQVKFIENKGQMTDMKNNPVPFVLFKAEAPGVDVYISEKGLTYVFIKPEEKKEEEKNWLSNRQEKFSYDWVRVDMILKNATIKKGNIFKEGESNNVSHYYVGHSTSPIRDVHSYEKITIKEIYPGIDWVFYNSNDRGFKYDFIIHPNADASQIKLMYEGDGKIEALNNQIHFENTIGELYEGKLFCYQGSESNEIDSKYIVKKNTETIPPLSKGAKGDPFFYEIEIELSSYNKNQSLTVDPQIAWATYIGGAGPDGPLSIACDPNNNILITGYQGSTAFPVLDPGGGAFYQGTYSGTNNSAFVMKFSNAGVLFWSSFILGNRGATGSDIVSDQLGNIILVGTTTSTNFPVFNPGGGAYFQPTRVDSVDSFIMKFNPLGVLTWGTYFGADSNDVAMSVSIDVANNIFITGSTNSLNFPVQNAGGTSYFQATNAGNYDGFIVKFNNAGVKQAATYFGGAAFDNTYAICHDALGNSFITGCSASSNLPLLNPLGGAFYQATNAGLEDSYVAKFNNTLTLNWSTYYGGTSMDIATAIATDLSGNIFISGFTTSASLPTLNPGLGAYYQAANAGSLDAFILKFTNTGVQQWGTFYGGSAMDYFKSPFNNITVDLCDNVYITFPTMSTDIPTQASCSVGYNPLTLQGPSDCFVLKFSNGGTRLWAIYSGGDGFDFREANTIDKLGNFFMTGEWHLPVNPASYPVITPGGGAYYNPVNNGEDGYVIKFSPTFISLSPNSSSAGCNCTGTATVTATGGCAPYQYLWYNTSWIQIGNTQTISNLCAGTYHVIVRDSMACSLPDTASVTLTGGAAQVTSIQNPIVCIGGSFVLPDGSSVSVQGTYIDTISLFAGCDSVITTNLTTAAFLTSSQNPVICAGQSFILPDLTTTGVAGTYVDTLIAQQGGCDSIITTTLVVNPAPTFTQSATICTGASYILPAGDTISAAGIYSDTLSTGAGCDSIITTTLILSPAPTSSQSTTLCSGNTFILPGGTSVSTAGLYIDTVSTLAGCDSIISTTISINPNSTGSQSYTMCSGNVFILPGGTSVTATGVYYDTLSSFNGCDSAITTTLTVNPSPTAGVSANITILIGQSTTITATGGGSYLWYPATGLDSITSNSVIATPSETTTYCVEVTSANGCKDTACVIVEVQIPCPTNELLEIPNAFSPNGDNVNDEFCLQGWVPCNENFTIYIYDRWGEKVFESKDPNFCWDGKYKGVTMDSQVFVYYIKAKFYSFDKTINRRGNISLIK